jgi:hypothetical protein
MKRVMFCAITGLLFSGLALSQTFNASLGGTVQDSSGAVIPSAIVTATGVETGVVSTTMTNTSGAYEFPSLQEGNYRVSAQVAGFKEFVYQRVVLDVGAQVRLNFTLTVGAANTTVEVSTAAESPLLTTSAAVGGVITGDEILHLPLIDQNAVNLALTQAQFAGGIGAGVSVAGGSTMTLATTVNGISVSNNRLDRAGGLLSFQLTQSIDMVEEVKVTSSPVDAENGRSLGSVSMIVRSGTNKFHGSLWDGLRNTDLDANTFWNNFSQPYIPRQTLIRNQFAARVGGPIRKNKTFFFVLYEGNRQRTSATATNTVLTAQARQGSYRYFPGAVNSNYSATSNPVVNANGVPVQPATATGPLQTVSVFGLDPNRPAPDASGVVQKIIAETPLPNNFTVGDGLNTAGYNWAVPSYADADQFTFKIDHYLNQNNHFSVVVTHEHQYYTSTASVYPTLPVTGDNEDHSWFASVNFDSTIKPTLLNQFKIGLQHPDLLQDSGVRAYPQVYPAQNSTAYIPGFASFTSPIPGSIESELVDPVYTLGDSMTWTHGRHSVKFGFQVDYTATNSYNINNNVTPAVTLGAGNTAVQGVNTLPGLVSQNDTLAQGILTDLTGSVSAIAQGFGVANGKNPQWIVYPSRAAFEQRDANGFIKDDFKVTSNVTVNFGMRWDWVGVPWEKWGRELSPTNGFAGAFGISGSNFNALWSPGADSGSLTQMETVGSHSANPGQQLYKNYYHAFEPAIGLNWAIPYFGQNKTVLRIGYGVSRPMTLSFLDISGDVTQFATSATFSAVAPTFLKNINLPLAPTFTNPLQIWPINDKTQSIDVTDPNFKPTVVQSYNVSLERQITQSLSLAVRYVGNHTTHQPGNFPLNTVDVNQNGIAAATTLTALGGNAPLFNQILNGVTIPGVGTVNGSTLTGSQALLQYSGTYSNFAGNSAGGLAGFFNTSQALGAAGTTPVRGWLLGNGNLPSNFIVVNPQYSGVTDVCACLNYSYNSGVVELIKRFSHGLVFDGNFVWAKSMSLNGFALNPQDWNAQREPGGQKFTWKGSGTYELPFGRGKQFLNATSGAAGVIDKVIGNWQYGAIFTLNSGSYLSFTCSGNPNGGTSDPCTSLQSMGSDPGHVIRTGNGVVYYNPSQFTQVKDPYCTSITNQYNLQSHCTDLAIENNGSILFANSALGQLGSMDLVSDWKGPSLFDIDMNLLKRFTVKEKITAEFRLDAISSTNSPHFPNPTTNIDSTSFGRISAPSSGGSNSFTTPAVFYGNRVFVANLRFIF